MQVPSFDPQSALYLYRSSLRKDSFYDVFVTATPDQARRALDVGCGDGRLALLLAEHAAFVVGVDPAFMMIGLARQKQIAQGKTNVAWVSARGESLPFADQSFDYVTSNMALRLTDLDASLPTIKRVVKRPGRVTILDLVQIRDSGSHRIWLVMRSLTRLPGLYRLFGWRGMWRAIVFRQPKQDVDVSLEAFAETYQRYFPGCRISNELRRARMEWEKTA